MQKPVQIAENNHAIGCKKLPELQFPTQQAVKIQRKREVLALPIGENLDPRDPTSAMQLDYRPMSVGKGVNHIPIGWLQHVITTCKIMLPINFQAPNISRVKHIVITIDSERHLLKYHWHIGIIAHTQS